MDGNKLIVFDTIENENFIKDRDFLLNDIIQNDFALETEADKKDVISFHIFASNELVMLVIDLTDNGVKNLDPILDTLK